VSEQLAHHEAEPLENALQALQVSEIVLGMLDVGVEKRRVQVGALFLREIQRVDKARHFGGGFSKPVELSFCEFESFHWTDRLNERLTKRERSRFAPSRLAAQECRNESGRGGQRKLFHREQRPAPQRNIIDTPQGALANDRYMIGHHDRVWTYTCRLTGLAAFSRKVFGVFEPPAAGAAEGRRCQSSGCEGPRALFRIQVAARSGECFFHARSCTRNITTISLTAKATIRSKDPHPNEHFRPEAEKALLKE
jgi:hypothetical protein